MEILKIILLILLPATLLASPREACHTPTPEHPLFTIRYRQQEPNTLKTTGDLLSNIITKRMYTITHYVDNSSPFVAGTFESLGASKPIIYGPDSDDAIRLGTLGTQFLYQTDFIGSPDRWIKDHWGYGNKYFLCPQVKWCRRNRKDTINTCFSKMQRRYKARPKKYRGVISRPLGVQWFDVTLP